MIRTSFSQTSPILKLLFTAFIAVISFLLIFIIGALLAMPIYNINILNPETVSILSNFDNVDLLKYLQVVQTIGLFVVPPFILGYFFNKNSIQYLKLNFNPKITSILIVVLTMFAAIPVINFLAEINSKLILPEFLSSFESWIKTNADNYEKITKAFLITNSTNGLIINILVMAVLPAIGEELFFRGVIQKILIECTKNIHIGIFITAIVFSLIHFQFYSFLPIMLMGIFLGYLFIWSNSIWLPITAHFINNITIVVFSYLSDNNIVSDKVKTIETIGTDCETIIYTIISIVLVSVFIYLIYKDRNNTD